MKKKNKVIAAATVGAATVVALGACSTAASDQAQDTSSASATQSQSPREAASADANKNVTVRGTRSGNFAKVRLTHAFQTKCNWAESVDDLTIKCTNVVLSVLGDSVFLLLPGKGYTVTVNNDSDPAHSTMQSTLRNFELSALRFSRENHKVWQTPNISTANRGWVVGVDSKTVSPIDVTLTVTMD